ncbi:hypothetical protein COV53_00535 [Candidatus Gottesmanbacteria bacterium CG11_big_fil_rev_8_21_14_0_20_37_11]|uniref:Solute-binding protein family 5 domain-containing protein n=3 Tax=Candidatus Gottesmaniibacteriota TaxID=1752720 RepID=A0A2M7RQJ8_9BACT|nr:MAG: hypothetical protein COV53_00535 [Candidatus Gottesmanbacteria bacterium CG11_big_fil_rev_8_21_14_0_20_37_11]PIZ02234.1 MAG: hypothetical protein COY59_05920 [Candidatus Gottesmanbacteria bacterium CG_4_10_14_0_8_um_filter_37_24]
MRKNIQFFLMYVQVFLNKFVSKIITGILIGFILTLFLVQIYPLYVKFFGKKEVKIGLVGKFTEKSLPLSIQNQISLGLTALTSSGEATPSLAVSWSIDDKMTTYTFKLIDNIYWSDNKIFSASDVNYILSGASFKVIDNHTLQVVLKEPYAPLPVILSQPLIRPKLIGLGFYKASNINYNGDQIDKLTLLPSDNKYPIVTYKFYPNNNEAILAFKLGEIDKLQNVNDIQDLRNWRNIKITEISLYDRIVLVIFNLQNQYFKEKEVRQAITYAIPKFSNFDKALSPISPQSWAYSKSIRLYNNDLEAAEKILGENPISSQSSELVLSTYSSNLSTAQMLVNSWNQVGLHTKVKVERSFPENFDLFLTVLPIPPDPDQYPYWQSTQTNTNLSHYSNQKIDKLLEDGRKTIDLESRKKIYADFQKYLVDDAPVIFLYYPKVFNIERK